MKMKCTICHNTLWGEDIMHNYTKQMHKDKKKSREKLTSEEIAQRHNKQCKRLVIPYI